MKFRQKFMPGFPFTFPSSDLHISGSLIVMNSSLCQILYVTIYIRKIWNSVIKTSIMMLFSGIHACIFAVTI